MTANSKAGLAVRRGRPVGDREAKRAELLRAAISVIAQEGFAGASLRKVAQRAGCTTGSSAGLASAGTSLRCSA